MAAPPRQLVRLLRYAGLALLAGLIVYAGPQRLWEAAAQAAPAWLLAAWLLNVPQVGLKALRWQRLVNWQGIALAYPRALTAYFGSLFVGFLTPGRLGEMAKAVTLKVESGVSLARALSSVVIDRVFDMYLLLPLGAFGIVRYAVVGRELSWPAFALLCALLIAPLALLHARTARAAGRALAALPLLRRRRAWLLERVEQFADGLRVLTPARIAASALLTLASYGIFFAQCLLCAWALGIELPYLDICLLMAATNFISFVPISISGLGTREACLVFFLSRVTPPIAPAVAVAYGLVMFFVFFVGAGLIGFVCWQWAPIALRDTMRAQTTERE